MTDGNKDRSNNITDSLANRTLIVTTILVSCEAQAFIYTPTLDLKGSFHCLFQAGISVCICLFFKLGN